MQLGKTKGMLWNMSKIKLSASDITCYIVGCFVIIVEDIRLW